MAHLISLMEFFLELQKSGELNTEFTHSICPECMVRLYPGYVTADDRPSLDTTTMERKIGQPVAIDEYRVRLDAKTNDRATHREQRCVENVYGINLGTASGMAPRARISTYKVCWGVGEGGCFGSDSVAAIDRDRAGTVTCCLSRRSSCESCRCWPF